MQIIKRIKIRNFRSFTGIKSEVIDLSDFNIFSGSNDSGKSNIFRALNLFFNNEITHGISFNMERDFSEQKISGTHKVVEIRLDFELSTPGTKYLSKKFAVEKRYYRWEDNAYDYFFIYVKDNGEELKISSNPDKNTGIDNEKQYRKQFNEFLGKINFEYIPAIRESKYFSYLFGRIISKLREAENDRISKVTAFIEELEDPENSIRKKKNLIKVREDKINGKKKKKGTDEYSEDYKNDMRKGIDNLKQEIENLKDDAYIQKKLEEQRKYKIKISEFQNAIGRLSSKVNLLAGDLFKNISFIENAEFTIADNLLDFFETFEIGTGVSKKISLKSRGDGMQSKFIPIILDFLSKVQKENEKGSFDWEYERNKYFIRGFEEPENSYEYSNSIKLANNFVGIKNKLNNEDGDFIKDTEGKYLYENINYSERKQIFITTHSEEFLRLFSEEKLSSKVSLYLIEKQKDRSSSIRFIDKEDLEDVHGNLGLTNIARSKLKFDIGQKITENSFLKDQIQCLLDELNKLEKSKSNILYVEDSYLDLYKVAYLKIKDIPFNETNLDTVFNKSSSFDIFGAEGASNLGGFLNAKNIDIFSKKKIVGLFDFDEEGKNQFKHTLKSGNNWGSKEGSEGVGIFRKRSNHNCFYALLLPVPTRLQSIANYERGSYVEIEHLLPESFLLSNHIGKQITVTGNTPCIEINDTKKNDVGKKSIVLPKESFEDFVGLFTKVEEIFNS